MEKELLEILSDIEHKQWIEWASSIMNSENISQLRKERWIKMMVPYSELSEEIKEHDRKYARIILGKVNQKITTLENKLKIAEEALEFYNNNKNNWVIHKADLMRHLVFRKKDGRYGGERAGQALAKIREENKK